MKLTILEGNSLALLFRVFTLCHDANVQATEDNVEGDSMAAHFLKLGQCL